MTKKENDFKKVTNRISKILLEFCFKYEVQNPKMLVDIIVNNGEEKYKLIFERVDLDEKD